MDCHIWTRFEVQDRGERVISERATAEGRDKSIESAMRTVHSTRHEEGTRYGEAEHKHDAREDHRRPNPS